MASSTIWINDRDLGSLGFTLGRHDGWRDGLIPAGGSPASATLPGRHGAVAVSGLGPRSETRELVLSGLLRASSAAALRAAREELWQLCQGTLEVRLADAPDLVLRAQARGLAILSYQPRSLTRAEVQVTLTLLALDPAWYSRYPTVVGLAAGVPSRCPLGTAAVAPVIRIWGPATNPSLTYRDAGGAVQGTLGLTVTLASTDWVEIDADQQTIVTVASGTRTSSPQILASGGFPVLDPVHAAGSRSVPTWPTVELSTGTGELQYHRAWR